MGSNAFTTWVPSLYFVAAFIFSFEFLDFNLSLFSFLYTNDAYCTCLLASVQYKKKDKVQLTPKKRKRGRGESYVNRIRKRLEK